MKMGARLRKLFGIPDRARPDLRQYGRTGDARYVPQVANWGRSPHDPSLVVCQANRWDKISVQDYDRLRYYPVVADALQTIRKPVERANFHFACSDPRVSALASELLTSHIRELIRVLMKGALEFGWQAVEIIWEPAFDVVVSAGQSTAEEGVIAYPIAWTVRRWSAFSAEDTRLLVRANTGEFYGVRQHVYATRRDVHRSKCVHFANDMDCGGNYGVARTKAVLPFVEIAESVWDDMALFSRYFAVPWKFGRSPGGSTSQGYDADGHAIQRNNVDIMREALEAMESGHSVSLPSEYDENGNQKWDISVVQPPAEDRYVDKLEFLHSTIRVGLMVPEMVSSQAPGSGTYNLGETQVDLFLSNVESYLDQLAVTINLQLLRTWKSLNFGEDAPHVSIVFEPVNAKLKSALLEALLNMFSAGTPIRDAEGGEYDADWLALAEDYGIPLSKQTLDQRADALRSLVMQRLDGPSDPGAPAEPPDAPTDPPPPVPGVALNDNRDPNGQYARSGTGDQTGRKGEDAPEDAPSDDVPADDPKAGESGSIEDHPLYDRAHTVGGIAPSGYGAFGPVYPQFKGDYEGARDHLMKVKAGIAEGVFDHPELGPIDLPWGEPASKRRRGLGLSKILQKHPEAVRDLDKRLESAEVDRRRSTRNKIVLVGNGFEAAVNLEYFGDKVTYLVTAYEPITKGGSS